MDCWIGIKVQTAGSRAYFSLEWERKVFVVDSSRQNVDMSLGEGWHAGGTNLCLAYRFRGAALARATPGCQRAVEIAQQLQIHRLKRRRSFS